MVASQSWDCQWKDMDKLEQVQKRWWPEWWRDSKLNHTQGTETMSLETRGGIVAWSLPSNTWTAVLEKGIWLAWCGPGVIELGQWVEVSDKTESLVQYQELTLGIVNPQDAWTLCHKGYPFKAREHLGERSQRIDKHAWWVVEVEFFIIEALSMLITPVT